jgi:GNAT superfamily N-acetyltransferase
MNSVDVVPMTSEHVDAAAELLAARQRRLRHDRPELPQAYSEPAGCRPVVAALADKPGAHGVMALRGSQPVGFLLGYPRPEPIWARAAWSPIEGSALADGEDPETIRDLYAPWSSWFVDSGHYRQYVHASPDEPELMAAWVRTGFGQMQAYALRDLDLAAPAPEPDGVTIRHAVSADVDMMEPLFPLIALALMRPPAYAISFPEDLPTYRDSMAEELAEEGARHFVAEQDGRGLAMASFYDAEPGPMVPEGAWEMAIAMTLPEARGRGLIRAILAAAFAEARQAGATHCETDWRTASLPTHRSWTALGFRPTHYRMHRHIDERIAWAAPR